MKYRIKWVKNIVGSLTDPYGKLYVTSNHYWLDDIVDVNRAYQIKNDADDRFVKAEFVIEEYEK